MFNFITTYQDRINLQLKNLLPDPTQSPERLHQAMHYAVMSRGKRLRPLLVYATGLSFGAELKRMDKAACAIEFIHCYSLVHDDLPAIDNDNYRRGKPTCHRAFDEATAILVGDALQSLAFEILAQEKSTRLVATLARASGSLGMVGGQQLDLVHKGGNEFVYQLKTGALFRAAVELGALCANFTNEIVLQQLRELGTTIGLIFQWQDDLDDQIKMGIKTQNFISERIDMLFNKIEQLIRTLNGNTTFINLIINSLYSKIYHYQ
ncbi:polyprenyl synthetase family protein [Coxiella endosymbiont of Rhipicephalus microplus]|uniref:polyprenyl synthetase family protein n=1 Tax=Coxiella endosymbiont of Rhipicephalus microplus TaxID=1656186 RepID=UPI000C7F7AEE|nr:polyprenyl synthetase family protein [Coxiella endosymbiont of Rhipicephalus microplus]PMB54717.1 Octaprenyl diphosphate synthase/Dimethylallyltransferase [Coxiella-like endosymbiont]